MGNRYDPQELTTIEAEALERYKERDKQIDDILVLIIQDIDLLKQKADNIDNVSLKCEILGYRKEQKEFKKGEQTC